MNIIIDPYFLEIEEEDEIKNNLSFFQTLISLCSSSKIKVYLYNELVDKMLERETKPFPIAIWKMKDEKLKVAVKNINRAFINEVMKNIGKLDIEECGGEQDVKISAKEKEISNQLLTDSRYYEMLSILLHQCYDVSLDFSECIVTGNIAQGMNIGDEFTISCACCKKFEATYRFGIIEEFQTDKDRALIQLSDYEKEKKFSFIKSPEIVRADHHNKLQKNSDFKTFEGVSRTNKLVLTLLRRFGLKKIIFMGFYEDSSRVKGTIVINSVKETNDGDILSGGLYAETGFFNYVDLYFPKNVGKNLKMYFEKELNRENVEKLVELIF